MYVHQCISCMNKNILKKSKIFYKNIISLNVFYWYCFRFIVLYCFILFYCFNVFCFFVFWFFHLWWFTGVCLWGLPQAFLDSIKLYIHDENPVHAVSCLTFFSLSPMYMERSSGPLTLKKWTLHSVATALARSVLPVPGGPNSSTPLRTFCPAKRSPCDNGRVMQLMISSLASCKPPTSAHCTLEAKVTATLDPPCNRFIACSMSCETSGAGDSSKEILGCDIRTSVQTDRRSVYERPAVSLAMAVPRQGSTASPWPFGIALAFTVPPINLAMAKCRCASVGRGTSISSRKACRKGPPISSKSSQDPATKISTRSSALAFRRAPAKASSTRRCCSRVAAGEADGPALAKAWSRRKHKTQGESLAASAQSSWTRASGAHRTQNSHSYLIRGRGPSSRLLSCHLPYASIPHDSLQPSKKCKKVETYMLPVPQYRHPQAGCSSPQAGASPGARKRSATRFSCHSPGGRWSG